MLLKDLYPECPEKFADTEISGITCNTKTAKAGFAFVCIKGFKTDGHLFADEAVEKGAAIVFAEKDIGLENQIIVEDTHAIYWQLSAAWFSFPADKMKLIGVTGTNGKTSTTYMIKKILTDMGYKVGLIGTIQNMIGDRILETERTTPDAYELNGIFNEMYRDGCDYVVMEVSSHALDQKRIYGVHFDVAVFTNLTQDHLDYHKTMENYLEAKKKLFYMCSTAVINADDAYAEKMAEGLPCKVVTVSALKNETTYSAKSVCYRPDGLEYQFVGYNMIGRIKLYTGGKFSVYNSMLAGAAALELGFGINDISKSLSEIKGIKGRAEVVPNSIGATFIIDYAHTPDGLENILTSFKDFEKERLTVLFGCGGDRDRTKRPIMGKIAVDNADFVIVTSDNPRSEEPGKIIDDILEGMKKSRTPYKVIESRTEAIKYAVQTAKKGDIVIFAGKGHENYQILKDRTIHLDEREVIAEAVKEIGLRGDTE